MATYEIIIKDESSSESKSNLSGEEDKKKKKKDGLSKTSNEVLKATKYIAMQSTRQLVVSKVGEYTRNNLLQMKINTAVGMAETAYAFSIHPVLGTVHLVTNMLSQEMDWQINLSKQNSRLSVMGERAGYINRSR